MAFKLLVLAVLCVVARIKAFSADELALRNVILSGGTRTLKKNVLLTADLPPIPSGKTVTLIGALNGGSSQVTIDGQGRYTIFRASASAMTLSLTNFIITRAKPLVNGAIAAAVNISAPGSTLVSKKVNFKSNARAIYGKGVVGRISGSQFSGHSKTAVVVIGADGFATDFSFDSCTFKGNKADDNNGGGAIFVYNSASNRASVTASKTTFDSNSAAGSVGGAVRLVEFSTGIFHDCKFTKNSAPDGGAVAAFNAYFTTVRCTFSGNTAGVGGAVRMRSDGEGINSLSKTTFTGNKATKKGGAFVINSDVDLTFCSCTFKSNTANGVPNNGHNENSAADIFTTPFTVIPLVTTDPGSDPPNFVPGDPCST